MSNEQVKMQEIDTTVVLTAEDCGHVRHFCTQFQIEMPPRLEEVLVNFEKDNSFENQVQIKLELCRWMCTSKHESFQDKLWDAPKEHAQELIYDIVFNQEVDKMLKGDYDDVTKAFAKAVESQPQNSTL